MQIYELFMSLPFLLLSPNRTLRVAFLSWCSCLLWVVDNRWQHSRQPVSSDTMSLLSFQLLLSDSPQPKPEPAKPRWPWPAWLRRHLVISLSNKASLNSSTGKILFWKLYILYILNIYIYKTRTSQVAQVVKNLPANEGAGDVSLIPGLGRSPGERNATHSSILAWRIPWTEELGGPQSTGLQRVRHHWACP